MERKDLDVMSKWWDSFNFELYERIIKAKME